MIHVDYVVDPHLFSGELFAPVPVGTQALKFRLNNGNENWLNSESIKRDDPVPEIRGYSLIRVPSDKRTHRAAIH